MGTKGRPRSKVEYGDFQTPPKLAAEICERFKSGGLKPASVFEPTCGVGAFLKASVEAFPEAQRIVGLDINPEHLERARLQAGKNVELVEQNFFSLQWTSLLKSLPDPIFLPGNPPWVTSADLGVLGSANLPAKSNFQRRSGMDALTGKSNFDVSEWILIHLADELRNRRATMAMLCKAAVARKLLIHCWKNHVRVSGASIRHIDALEHFEANVGACLLTLDFGGPPATECAVFAALSDPDPVQTIGFVDGRLVADVGTYERVRFLENRTEGVEWRSGIKHDCARVMELTVDRAGLRNGFEEYVDIEPTYLYPLLKSSDVAHGIVNAGRYMLVPQTRVGEETDGIQKRAPKTWTYLKRFEPLFQERSSPIYRGKPPFAIFGVGEYSFAPWKVAISGLYRAVRFAVVGPRDGRPTVLDDTCYFAPCDTEDEAVRLAELLNGRQAMEFFRSLLFLDNKRPVTVELLRRLDVRQLGSRLTLRPAP